MRFKARLPFLLILLRLLLGLLILILSITGSSHYATLTISMLTAGLLSDIFDGIIARHLKLSTERLRRMDSTVDQVFFIAVTLGVFLHCPDFFRNHWLALSILLGFEALTYIVSFIKFRKEVATHTIGAKLWTLTVFITLVQLIWQCDSGLLFQICFWLGLISRLEIILIILTLKHWTTDVPTLVHAMQSRKGKAIKRHKLFNG